ncbi:MAG: ubiquinol-cytochrome c reductase iron-sulfur subunit [Candidatus Dormibacteraeota bacterium]|uniref:Ubiquinol-cytochrome c reductase iron-sulfur subunit n=1 Tax=Candidatus Amunia macphersoniae TaxID=3127014 RepID=A0A934KT41_9BACT|nr:ubiquinol-cytochrome c reductase iron-sulfur subunit [Candidatus Dormibacteraeota bacterium]
MKKMSRREVLIRGTGLGMGLIGVMLSVPAVGFLLSPLFTKQKLTWITVGPIDEVPVNQPTAMIAEVPVGTGYPTPPVKRIVYVVKKRDGPTLALSNICTHMQCDVHWDPSLGNFLCPCHGGLYDIDGNNTGGPPPQPLAQWVHRTHTDAQGRTILEIQNQLDEHI